MDLEVLTAHRHEYPLCSHSDVLPTMVSFSGGSTVGGHQSHSKFPNANIFLLRKFNSIWHHALSFADSIPLVFS